ncbi:hypothetical protein C8J56DRAFT_39347 [Mycena floridula]|nr:hypothetical protein C8J56DRAFT_39347 [Mycena floridula]
MGHFVNLSARRYIELEYRELQSIFQPSLLYIESKPCSESDGPGSFSNIFLLVPSAFAEVTSWHKPSIALMHTNQNLAAPTTFGTIQLRRIMTSFVTNLVMTIVNSDIGLGTFWFVLDVQTSDMESSEISFNWVVVFFLTRFNVGCRFRTG